ncbi:MAG TPA: VWA domain-containing protein [Blastocatellia bacterium]|nr:VWA domain-containing protein [Blastocatellia bacterium]
MVKSVGILSLVICIFLATSGFPQTQKTGDQDQGLQLQSNLIELRAVVTDKQGHLIDGLKKEDFELAENNQPQQISFFSVENAVKAGGMAGDGYANGEPTPPNAPETPTRTVAIYVDTLNLSLQTILRVKQLLHTFIDQQLTTGDLAAIISDTGSGGVLEQFTRDRKILHYAIDKLNPSSSFNESMLTPNLAAGVLRGDAVALNLAESLVKVEERTQAEGRSLEELTKSRANQVISEASYRRRASLFTVKAIADRLSKLPGQRIITMLSEGFTSLDQSGSIDNTEIESVISHAVQSGVMIYTIDAKGLRTPPGLSAEFPGMPGPESIPLYHSYMSQDEKEAMDGLHALARDTGGELLMNNNDLVGVMKRILKENQIYYAIAYYPSDDKDQRKFRNITLKVKNHPEYKVRTQKGYSPAELLKAVNTKPQTPRQRLVEAMTSPLPVTNIGVSANASFLGRDEDPQQVVFEARIEGNNINYKEQDNKFHFDLDLVTVVTDANGKVVDSSNDKAKGDFLPETLGIAKQNGYRYTRFLSLKPGLYQIHIGVYEGSTERIGTAVALAEVPDLNRNKLTLSSIFLSDSPIDKKPPTANVSNPANGPSKVKQGIRFYKPNSYLSYNARIYNIGSGGDSDLSMELMILKAGAKFITVPWQPVTSRVVGRNHNGVDIGGMLKLDIPPGLYEFQVQIKRSNSKEMLQQSIVFGVE